MLLLLLLLLLLRAADPTIIRCGCMLLQCMLLHEVAAPGAALVCSSGGMGRRHIKAITAVTIVVRKRPHQQPSSMCGGLWYGATHCPYSSCCIINGSWHGRSLITHTHC
jgi:hypothetical protein